MTRQQTFAALVRDSSFLLKRYLKDFDDTTAILQAPGLPNHVIWTLGHLAVTMYRSAGKLDGGALPTSVFIEDAHAGDALRFAVSTVAYGSRPKVDAALYPAFDRALAIFDDAIDRLAGVAEAADDATIERPVAWGASTISAASLLGRMVFHNGSHCGQIADLRRALGMPNVL